MFFDYRFWHFLTRPFELASQLQTGTMRHFNRRLYLVFLAGIVLFVLREAWGMGTETLTSLMSDNDDDRLHNRKIRISCRHSTLVNPIHSISYFWNRMDFIDTYKNPISAAGPAASAHRGRTSYGKGDHIHRLCIARRFRQPFIPIIRSACRYSYGELVSNPVFEPIDNYKRTDHHIAI